jgi:hypothetical protein
VLWLNADERVPPPRRAGTWTLESLWGLMHNPVYMGHVRYNRRQVGLYERAAPGSTFTAEGKHERLIEPELWHEVQRRLAGARKSVTYTRLGPRVLLASGLLVCADCGSPMVAARRDPASGCQGQYNCLRHNRGKGGLCTASGYRIDVAHAALLTEVRRADGALWTPQAERRLAGTDGASQAEGTRR